MIKLSNIFKIEWIYIRIIKVVVYNVDSLKIAYKASNIIYSDENLWDRKIKILI